MLPTAVKIIINIVIAAIALRLCFVKDDYSGERKFHFGLFILLLVTVWFISKLCGIQNRSTGMLVPTFFFTMFNHNSIRRGIA